jgi:aryl carrier-like protein
MDLRNAGRKEGVDIHLVRLYNVATIISAKTFIT